MAQENIQVEFQPEADTASFDVKRRILTLPQYKGMTTHEVALFIAHEVSHASNTNWVRYSAIIEKVIKTYNLTEESACEVCNIVEDIRIEKLSKRRFPGVKRDFFFGYRDLYSRFAEGKAPKSASGNANLMGRINYHFKFGYFEGVEFTPEEKNFVDIANDMETLDDVEDVVMMLVDYHKQNNMITPSGKPKKGTGDGEGEIVSDGVDAGFVKWGKMPTPEEGDKGDKIAPTKSSKTDKSDSDSNNKGTPNTNNQFFMTGAGGGLYDHTKGSKNMYVDMPIINNLDKMMIPFGRIKLAKNTDASGMETFLTSIRPAITLMASIFNRKKRATDHRKSSIGKTGAINPNSLVNYKFTEDIFKTFTQVHTGKKHGVVMYIDWSGSMDHCLFGTVKQLIVLTEFCKRIGVPYEVLAFSNAEHSPQIPIVTNPNGAMVRPVTLLNFLSSSAPANKHKELLNSLWAHGRRCATYSSEELPYRLGGTPLNEAAFHAFNYLPQFKRERKLDIVNMVFLTDGGAENTITNRQGTNSQNAILRHKFATFTAKQHHGTDALMQCIRDVYGVNALCFYIDSTTTPINKSKDSQGYTAHYKVSQESISSANYAKDLLNNKSGRAMLDEIATYFS